MCSPASLADDRTIPDPTAVMLDNNAIQTYRSGHYGLFPNGDSPYLVTPLISPYLNYGKIAVLRFKPPNFPNTRAGDDFSGNEQVRYWSVCIGDWVWTNVSQCKADHELKTDAKGYVNLVIGSDLLAPAYSKWNNLRWGLHANPILIFRQISPNQGFGASFETAPIAFDQNSGIVDLDDLFEFEKEKVASESIGEYAPAGKYCTTNEFLLRKCVFKRRYAAI